VALGWLGTLSTEARRDTRADAREKSAREAARADAFEQQHASFELDNLVELYSLM
jgi:hypothetical protein